MPGSRSRMVERVVALGRPALLDGGRLRLRLFGSGLWSHDGSLRMGGGARLPVRMLVARLAEGGLLVWSPLELTDELRDALDELGPVRFVVAPNTFHHMFAGDFAAAYPGAELWGPPGLRAKRPDLHLAGELGDTAPEGWMGELEQRCIGPLGNFCEVAFLHRASRSLILTDLGFRLRDLPRFADRVLWRVVTGSYGRFGPTRMMRAVLRRDPLRVRVALDAIARWDFDHVLMAHGTPIVGGGREAFEGAYANWL